MPYKKRYVRKFNVGFVPKLSYQFLQNIDNGIDQNSNVEVQVVRICFDNFVYPRGQLVNWCHDVPFDGSDFCCSFQFNSLYELYTYAATNPNMLVWKPIQDSYYEFRIASVKVQVFVNDVKCGSNILGRDCSVQSHSVKSDTVDIMLKEGGKFHTDVYNIKIPNFTSERQNQDCVGYSLLGTGTTGYRSDPHINVFAPCEYAFDGSNIAGAKGQLEVDAHDFVQQGIGFVLPSLTFNVPQQIYKYSIFSNFRVAYALSRNIGANFGNAKVNQFSFDYLATQVWSTVKNVSVGNSSMSFSTRLDAGPDEEQGWLVTQDAPDAGQNVNREYFNPEFGFALQSNELAAPNSTCSFSVIIEYTLKCRGAKL